MLITGGTIDKEYDEIRVVLIFKKTHIHEILKLGTSKWDIKITELMMIDSANITNSNKRTILNHCKKSKEDKIVIIHGTDTMVTTAQFLGKFIKNKIIVLTGAMIPYAFGNSDSIFNLGSALAFVQTLPYGVYISMHGKYFSYDKLRKNKQIGEFEKVK
jgi:L-asparaginase